MSSSSTTSQAMLNQILFQDHQDVPSSSSSLFCVSSNNNITGTALPFESLKTLITPMPTSLASLLPPLVESSSPNSTSAFHQTQTLLQQHQDLSPLFGPPHHQLLSLHRSAPNLWAWGEVNECMMRSKRSGLVVDDHRHHHLGGLGVSAVKMKKMSKSRRKVREPRFSFKTMSDVDVLDDGYKWRKYGQKVVKNTQHPRSYYRCTQDNCRVKKRVERLAEDPRMVITTYEGRHVHSPSHDDDDSQASSQANDLLW
nr:probable WRKY transcription factor 13 [Ipomoea batatas]